MTSEAKGCCVHIKPEKDWGLLCNKPIVSTDLGYPLCADHREQVRKQSMIKVTSR